MATPGLAGASTAASAAGSRQAAVLKLFSPPPAGSSQPGGQFDSIEFEFNPKELTMGKEADWTTNEGQRADSASPPQYKGPKASRLALELFLDDSAERRGTVVAKVEKLFACCTPKTAGSDNTSPPWVQFQWGGITSFVGYVSSVQARYTLFTPAGLPVRAVVSVTLQEFPSTPPRQNPTSGTLVPHREHVVVAGDTLQGIAYREYGDAARWRDIAAANGVDDPARLPPGLRLLLPLRGEDEAAGDGRDGADRPAATAASRDGG